ncbi:hypothetical protein SAMN02745753_03505 [Marinomonas polaris DSM 16579]|uniref:Uncharacterized protein n=1 Tax=Marinomonas polaris DSM 16579 TaxID=1122206 RepID=A0A1M5I4A0_9GAMM|nr:hypothetical protein [Marinomonas polaris]SHG23071.1 hypothetical protein SAMN02745753_03505 [Marinomonas polaris DSM 16579]
MNCDWCKESMDDQAIVCPSCKRERKDFHNLKLAMYTFVSLSFAAFFYGIISGAFTSPFLGEFQFRRIFSTVPGWIGILSFVISQVLYVKASKIIKTWWWY